jgi:hypothetical protein
MIAGAHAVGWNLGYETSAQESTRPLIASVMLLTIGNAVYTNRTYSPIQDLALLRKVDNHSHP